MELQNETLPWKSISLTHVEYQKGDYVGMVLAWFSLLPIFSLVSMGSLILFRRDLHTVFLLAGFVANEALNYTLKHLIKELRPLGHRVTFTEYGMPSSHAQFSAFFASYAILFLYVRVYLLYHSSSQVYWGLLVGVVAGCTGFCTIHFLLTPFFPLIASWRLSEWLMLRDTTSIPNIMWFEYCSQRTEAINRLKMMQWKKSS